MNYLCAGFIPRINKRREKQRIKEIQKKIENMDYTLEPTQTRYPLTWTHAPGDPPISDPGYTPSHLSLSPLPRLDAGEPSWRAAAAHWPPWPVRCSAAGPRLGREETGDPECPSAQPGAATSPTPSPVSPRRTASQSTPRLCHNAKTLAQPHAPSEPTTCERGS